jgi:phage-related tail protein
MNTRSNEAPEKRKPLGVRATPEEHAVITEAARREHRSVNSFVLRAALQAATNPDQRPRRRTPEEIQLAITRAQEIMRPYRQAGRSLVDDLIAERRAEAARE